MGRLRSLVGFVATWDRESTPNDPTFIENRLDSRGFDQERLSSWEIGL
jgi:hypothetical protein